MGTITTILIFVNLCLVGSVMRMASADKELHSVGTPVELILACPVAWTEYVLMNLILTLPLPDTMFVMSLIKSVHFWLTVRKRL